MSKVTNYLMAVAGVAILAVLLVIGNAGTTAETQESSARPFRAGPMLKYSVDLDTEKPGIQVTRDVEVGSTFQIALMVEGEATTPTVFDTVILEVLFNDKGDILHVDRGQRPVAGELAGHSPTTVDAFSRESVKPGRASDQGIPFSQGSLLTLLLPPEDQEVKYKGHRWGPYASSTGQAGLSDFSKLFSISSGAAMSVAAGKVASGFHAATTGTSSIIAVGRAFRGSTPIPATSVVGTVNVGERRTPSQ